MGQPPVLLAKDLKCISSYSLSTCLCHFIMKARNRTGDLYPARIMCAGICQYLKYEIGRPDCNFCRPIILYLLKQGRILIRRCVSPQTKVLEPQFFIQT